MKGKKNGHKKLVRKRNHGRNYESDNQHVQYKRYLKGEFVEDASGSSGLRE